MDLLEIKNILAELPKIRDIGKFRNYDPTNKHKDVIYYATDKKLVYLNGELYGGITEEQLQAIQEEIDSKVNKEDGKGLSTNDFSNTDKAKLDSIDLDTLATKSEVDTRIQNIIGTAPEALDTLGEIADKLSDNDDVVAGIVNTLAGKVDKVEGKQLSTEDFTTALKTKLEGLSNYNDTELSDKVSQLETKFTTLLEANPDEAINSFNEIVAFLENISDSDTLEEIVASIQTTISNNLNTVNNYTINGHKISENPTLNKSDVGLSNVNNTSDLSKPISTATQTALNNKVDKVTGKSLSSNDFTTEYINKINTSESNIQQLQTTKANVEDLSNVISEEIANVEDDEFELPAGITIEQLRRILLPRIVHCTETTKEIQPNTYYVWGEVDTLNISFAESASTDVIDEYMIEFDSGNTPTVLNLPESIKFATHFTIEANKHYQVSIVNNIGVIYGV